MRTKVWAVRVVETGERVTYRYRDRKDAEDWKKYLEYHNGGKYPMEVYSLTQDLPRRGCK